jgi:hypothetical protein
MSTRRKRTVLRSRQNQDENKRKKRLLVAFLMLILTGVALTTATYAWFSANDSVDTTDIDLKVTAATGISISADALNFGKTISMADVIGFAREGCSTAGDTEATLDTNKQCKSSLQYPEKLNPVSTIGPVAGAAPKWFLGAVADKKSSDMSYVAEITARSEAETYVTSSTAQNADHNYRTSSGDYLAFDFWIRSGADDVYLDIDNATTKIEASVPTSGTASLESGLRIMFVEMGFTPDTGSADRQKTAKDLNTVSSSNWVLYNPFPDRHHSASLTDTYDTDERTQGYYAVNRAPNYSTDTLSRYDKKGVSSSDGTYIPFTFKTINAQSSSSSYKSIFKLIDNDYSNYAVATSSSNLATGHRLLKVDAGVTKFRCYVWLEGQDIDTVDEISFSQGIKLNFGFKIAGA